ncbi:hypothetical protein EV361DRAFT_954396 [Lentinula raphanica]|nr:hypothetical protein EV361DRAFT_954396 [Lentinula raphanica]
MSRFVVSFSQEETEAALAYYSSHALQLPPSVSKFFQALLGQVFQEGYPVNFSQETNNHLASTDIQTGTNFLVTMMNLPQATTIIRPPHPPTSFPLPSGIFHKDGCSQTSYLETKSQIETPKDLNQTFPPTNLTHREGFLLPTPPFLPPRTFQETGPLMSGKTSVQSGGSVNTTLVLDCDTTVQAIDTTGPSVDLTAPRVNLLQTVDFAGQEGSENSRKRKIIDANENDELEESDWQEQEQSDQEQEQSDPGDDEDYVDGHSGRGSRGGRGSQGGRGSRGSRGGRGGQGGRGGRVRVGGGNCSRNGANVSRRRSGQNLRLESEALGDDPGISGGASRSESEDPEMEGSSGAGAGGVPNESFVYSSDRAVPSQEVQQESTLLLLALSSSPSSLNWMEGFVKAIEGEPWAESDALTLESLKNLALRCSHSKNMDVFATFCRMLNELMFAAKVNSIIHAQQRAFPSKTPSIKGIVNNLKQEGFSKRELGTWMSSGTRWARVAGAGSIYSLILIAEKRLSYRWGREVSSAALNQISSSPLVALALVQDALIPTIVKLQKAIAFTIPVLFSFNTREIYRLPSVINIAQIEETDWYFDLFYYRIAVNVPRSKELWKEVLEFRPRVGNLTSFYSFNQRHLNSSSKQTLPAITAWDIEEGPLSDEEMEEAISSKNTFPSSSLPPVTFSGFAGEILKTESQKWGPIYVVKSCFNHQKLLLRGNRSPFTPNTRDSWTEKQRKIVLNGERPSTLEEFSEKMQLRYDEGTGAIRAKQKWLFLTQEAIGGKEIKVLDEEDKTVLSVDSTLPEEQRKNLRNAIVAFCYSTSVNLQNRDTTELDTAPTFQVWHLSYYARFGQSGKPIPKDFHPLHVKRSDGSKVNHAQFFVRASKDLQLFGREFCYEA